MVKCQCRPGLCVCMPEPKHDKDKFVSLDMTKGVRNVHVSLIDKLRLVRHAK